MLVAGIVVVLAAALLAPAAAAQGCAMCAQNAAAAGPEGARAINTGILILLLPTLGIFGGLFVLIVRRHREDASNGDL
jgi:heme/copper-type cytochrome/quinol oxidase subunit 2